MGHVSFRRKKKCAFQRSSEHVVIRRVARLSRIGARLIFGPPGHATASPRALRGPVGPGRPPCPLDKPGGPSRPVGTLVASMIISCLCGRDYCVFKKYIYLSKQRWCINTSGHSCWLLERSNWLSSADNRLSEHQNNFPNKLPKGPP